MFTHLPHISQSLTAVSV